MNVGAGLWIVWWIVINLFVFIGEPGAKNLQARRVGFVTAIVLLRSMFSFLLTLQYLR